MSKKEKEGQEVEWETWGRKLSIKWRYKLECESTKRIFSRNSKYIGRVKRYIERESGVKGV